MESQCSRCHISVRLTDYYCFNCGNNLRPAPMLVTVVDQINLYGKSILLPPFGILFALKYLKQKELKTRVIGVTAIGLTLLSLVIMTIWLKNTFNTVNSRINEQLNLLNY